MSVLRPGAWPSPISAATAVGAARAIADLEIDNGVVWLTELRPDEGGRSQIVRLRPDGVAEDVLPPDVSARSRVHEYGGGAILPDKGAVYFINDADQQIWRDVAGGAPQQLTRCPAMRFADLAAQDGLLVAVCEDHSGEGEPVNGLAAIDPVSGAVRWLWRGADFVAHPRFAPGGHSLAWVSWSHPAMPWDATSIHVGRLGSDGTLAHVYTIVSAREGFSALQPAWSDDGDLYFVWDAPGDWALHVWRDGKVELVAHLDGEIGSPQWQFRPADFALAGSARAWATLTRDGADRLVTIDLKTGTARPVTAQFSAIRKLLADGDSVIALAASAEAGFALHRIAPGGQTTEIYRPRGPALDPAFVSRPRAVRFGASEAEAAHGFYYPPASPAHSAAEPPPLIVTAHGGPTALSKPQFAIWRAYWTSRGFAILDVNYRGSTGFGRAYRRALDGRWGEADIADVVKGVRHCAAQGLADPARMAIYGGSAGGFAVLAALAFHPGIFSAGVSLYGISDLEALAQETHKFESRYTDTLIGPLPQARDIYRARSPLFASQRIAAPLLMFQGLDDKAVPPSQSEAIYQAVKGNGLPTAYLTFAGEGHGFRKAENQIRTLTATHYFLARVFGLAPAEDLEPIAIDNL